jgi:hypothetical protein
MPAFLKTPLCTGAFLLAVVSAHSLPTLQLDIGGGMYIGGNDQTVYANGNTFSLYALYNGTPPTDRTFYISAAIVPRQNESLIQPNFGSFRINGTSYSTGLNYGLPPVDVVDGLAGAQNLARHDIYPTYYAEIAFHFTALQVAPYDTAGNPASLSGPAAGAGMYYARFEVDVSDLLTMFSVHFDLYDETIKLIHDGNLSLSAATLDDFAPFSHDAQSRRGGGGSGIPQVVADGGSTIALLVCALATLGALSRKLRRA